MPASLAITLLGSTGSIGDSSLDVIRQHPERYRLFALTAHQQVDKLLLQCLSFQPEYAVVDSHHAPRLRQALAEAGVRTQVLSGPQALCDVAAAPDVAIVIAAIVGAAGLKPTMAAVKAGKRLLLANKEALVMSGHLLMHAAAESGSQVLPVDSEHNAIFQCLPSPLGSLTQAGVKQLLLTGSGGPFRTKPLNEFGFITPEQACAHPNWQMGKKISVDSATMMNKGLEFIEASWLFGASAEQIQVLLHPQSIVHSMVQYCDGSVIAQLGQPDMRTPIAHCLAWPERISANVPALDFCQLPALSFSQPCPERYPCLWLAINSFKAAGCAPAALNAANEVAVAAFLGREIGFLQIAHTVDAVMQAWNNREPTGLDAVEDADAEARRMAQRVLASFASAR